MKTKKLHKLNASVNTPMILAVTPGGRPNGWLHWKEAAAHYATNDVVWSLGEPVMTLTGGKNNNNDVSLIELAPIISVTGMGTRIVEDKPVLLTNLTLFKRDQNICMYCGNPFGNKMLTRDHVIPRGQGGRDVWNNVVSACSPCNSSKDCRTPAQAHMPLLALPYTPNYIESFILTNKNIVADQMEFLKLQLPNKKRECFM